MFCPPFLSSPPLTTSIQKMYVCLKKCFRYTSDLFFNCNEVVFSTGQGGDGRTGGQTEGRTDIANGMDWIGLDGRTSMVGGGRVRTRVSR